MISEAEAELPYWAPEEPRAAGAPPHDLDAEAAVIWAALFRDGALAKLTTVLTPGDFYSEAHACFWEALQALFASGKEPTVFALSACLKAANKSARSGGDAYLAECIGSAPVVGRPLDAASTLVQHSRLRLTQRLCHAAAALVYSPIEDADGFVDALVRDLETVRARGRTRRAPITVQESHKRAYQDAVARSMNTAPRGISTGFRAIDAKIGGLGASELTVLAGRPGMGKTALALRIAEHVALTGHGTLFVSLEMPSDQLSARMLCSQARVPIHRMRAGTLNAAEWGALTRSYVESVNRPCPMLFWEWPLNLKDLVAIVKDASAGLARADSKLSLVVLDHVQLVRQNAMARSREESVSETARALKSLALDVGCHVMALSQLNRSVEQREDKRPLLSDLRESGAIEEAADTVLSLYRPSYYDADAKDQGALIGVLKNRHGPTEGARLEFDAKTITFADEEDHA